MKRLTLLTLILLLSTSSFSQTNCVGSYNVTVNPTQPQGGYAPGTTVSVCVSVINYSQAGASWLHGVGMDFGPGWDESTIIPGNVTGCDGQGNWMWVNSCVATGTGFTFGPGFYYDSPAGSTTGALDNNPCNNYGDNCQNNTWNFCLTIETAAVSSNPIPLTGTITMTSDAFSGSWGTQSCNIEYVPMTGSGTCYASFNLATPPVVQMPLSFVNTSAGVSPTFTWDFGDGNTSTDIHPTHTYNSIGTYPVCLGINTPTCTNSLCANITIVPNYWQNTYPYFAAGEVYYDLDSNGIRGVYEPGLNGVALNISTVGQTAYTMSSGAYDLPLNPGNYNISAPTIPNWVLSSDSSSYAIAITNASVNGFDFGYKPTQYISDLNLTFQPGGSNCIFPTTQFITITNTGTMPANGIITYLKHDSIFVNSTSPTPDSIVQNIYYWNYLNLVPTGIFQVSLNVDKPDIAGYTYNTVISANILNHSGQIIVMETDTIAETVTCSYDPNDKQVSPVTNINGEDYTLMDEELTYTIRFQNTGNAPAVNVHITDTLPAVMDLSTFQFVSSSHTADIHITPGGILTFNFYAINLPDSISNEPESHGYVTFTLEPLPGLANYTIVENSANIFFDNNSPIVTNTAQTTYVINFPIGVPETGYGYGISIYPNPAGNSFTVFRNRNGLPGKIRLLSVLGAEIISQNFDAADNSIQVDCLTLPAGVYLIRVEDANGSIVKRLVKK